MIGLYLYASGAQRQCITVLSTLGLSESYTNLMSKNLQRIRRPKKPLTQAVSDSEDNPFLDNPSTLQPPQPQTETPRRTGTVYQLSDIMRARSRAIADGGLYAETFDNVNIGFGNTEQIVGRHGRRSISEEKSILIM